MYKIFVATLIFIVHCSSGFSQVIVSDKNEPGSFHLIDAGKLPSIIIDKDEDSLLHKSAALFRNDLQMISGTMPILRFDLSAAKSIILIGNIQRSKHIKQLVAKGKINVNSIKGKWEAYTLQVVDEPFPGIKQALVVMGSDRRGAAYGLFELSKKLGVSPWYWWADIPVEKKHNLFVKASGLTDMPKVKYRGIFINDEAPALSGWSKEKFGGFNHLFYEKVFELMLRLKANYLWPAMWGNAFYDDDPLNKQTADNYGIVIGTSHHEPLMRAHDEWRRYGKGKWNYDSNRVQLQQFWKDGIERVKNTETITSIGMRGDGDEPMTRETATALLERIVKDQRKIIESVTGKPADQTPQLWALYKEVQDYYDKGMRVPDDVTLLLCDDNWGNIRKLPKLSDKPRVGGYGIYYHFDYVGGPRNYKWINTNNIARVWEQMNLAYNYGVDKIWIVNVGDIKPMEFPISFFLDHAWNPARYTPENVDQYYEQWSADNFGQRFAKEIGDIIRKYSQYNARRKPELLSPQTYSLVNYNEADSIVKQYASVLGRAEAVYSLLDKEFKDAYYQLVLHPVRSSSTINEMYVAAAKNHWYAESNNNANANKYAKLVKQLYEKDSLITREYHTLKNGKWNHMMAQTHIGYTYWQQPPFNKMPEVKILPESKAAAEMTLILKQDAAQKFTKEKGNKFFQQENYISIEAEHFTNAQNTSGITWKVIPGIGRTAGAISTFPVTKSFGAVSTSNPSVEYHFDCNDTGNISVHAYFSPTLNFHNDDGLRYAVSLDDQPPVELSINKDDKNQAIWGKWVADNIIIKSSTHRIKKSGSHKLKYWMVSPAVVLQKLVLSFGQLKPSYLGPPETKFIHQ